MRLMILAVPSVMALACAGGMLALAMRAKQAPAEVPQAASAFEWRHFVTAKMSHAAAKDTGRLAPCFHVRDVAGNEVVIGGPNLPRPQLVYFVNTECPCSYAAEPMFHSLSDQFKGQVDFICVTNGDAKTTQKWVKEMDVPYPAVSDKRVDIMKAYHAPSSVYSALVTKDGHVVEMWPGFSKGYLLDMNQQMASLLGQPERPFDTQYAPTQQATGCTF